MLGFQRENLVVSLLVAPSSRLGLEVQIPDAFCSFFDFALIAVVNAGLDALLLSHHVDFLSHLSVT